MQITTTTKVGQTQNRKSVVKTWKSNPGNFDAAAHAAAYYAKKNKKNMVVVPGNSYMQKIYHIVDESQSIAKFTINRSNNPVALVTPAGEVFRAVAND